MLASRAADGDTTAALGVVQKLAAAQQDAARARFRLVPKNDEMEKAIKVLIQSNPTDAPGVWDSEEKTSRLANGEWRVLYAPHMYVLQQVRAADILDAILLFRIHAM